MAALTTAQLDAAHETSAGFCSWCDALRGELIPSDALAERCPECRLPCLYGLGAALRYRYAIRNETEPRLDHQPALFGQY